MALRNGNVTVFAVQYVEGHVEDTYCIAVCVILEVDPLHDVSTARTVLGEIHFMCRQDEHLFLSFDLTKKKLRG